MSSKLREQAHRLADKFARVYKVDRQKVRVTILPDGNAIVDYPGDHSLPEWTTGVSCFKHRWFA